MESTKPQNQNIELQGEVLFRRKMGKNLCFLTISTTNELTDQIECVLKIPEIIKQITIGDIIQANGQNEPDIFAMYLILTEECNMNCKYCSQSSFRTRKRLGNASKGTPRSVERNNKGG